MRHIRDTFLHFLADNLVGITVRNVRQDLNDPSSALLQTNAVNVQFLNMTLRNDVSRQQVVIDVLHDNELTAVEWIRQLWDILKAAFYTPALDYTNPSSPVSAVGNIMWDRDRIRFSRVSSAHYTHYSCVIDLQFQS